MTGVPTWFTTTDRANIQAILAILNRIEKMEKTEMSSIDDLVSEVATETSEVKSVQTFIAGIEQQLSDALSGISLPPAQQAKIDQMFVDLKTNNDALAAAITTSPGGSTGTTGTAAPPGPTGGSTGPTGPTGP